VVRALIVAAGCLLVVSGCGEGSGDPESGAGFDRGVSQPDGDAGADAFDAVASGSVSFADEILPIVGDVCARCHTGEGPGTAHVAMDTAAQVADAAFDIGIAVASGQMPPWPASSAGLRFRDDWSLEPDEVDAVVAWAEAGGPLDIEATQAIEPTSGTVGLERPDVAIRPDTGYGGEAGQPDEYRCFVYDPAVDQTSYVEAYEFVPDQSEVVHHAIGYLVPAERRSRAVELAALDPQGGWSCFGGSGLGVSDIFLGWAPGQTATEFEEGSGLRVGPGDFMVIQVHYHFEVDAPPDRSTLRIRWADAQTVTSSGVGANDEVREVVVGQYFAPAEIPCFDDETGPLCDRDAAMARALESYGPAGVQADFILALCGRAADEVGVLDDSGVATGSCDQPVRNTGRIVSVLGHAHELGSSFRMTLNPGRADEQVLLDIPDWSFDWQFNYEPVDEIVLRPGDTIRVECSWDRNRRHPSLEPAYVLWADGTDDEMCFATIATVSSEGGGGGASAATDLTALLGAQAQACVEAAGADTAAGAEPLARALLECADPASVADRAVDTLSGVFGVVVGDGLRECLAETYSQPEGLADLLDAYGRPDDPAAVSPAAATFSECAPLGSVIAAAVPDLELSASSVECLDERGGSAVEDLFARALRGEGPRLPAVVFECLTLEEVAGFGG
jgi:hypothetical protein